MVEVFINYQKIDVLETSIRYVKQVNDLADVTTVNTSYSYSLTVPKTPINTRTFEGLGLIGDTSRTPYTKNFTQIIDNGNMIVPNGTSYVKETSDDYKLVIQDGIIDFFRAIENKTLGVELDLSELSHSKTAANIIASFTNPYYRYLISEYNGQTVKNSVINPDYQIPSINLKYLFDKIMDYAGYTYEGLPDISGEWQTYPSPPAIPDDEDTLIFQGFHSGRYPTLYAGDPQNSNQWKNRYFPIWDNITVSLPDYVTVIDDWYLKIASTGNYKVNFSVNGFMRYGVTEGNTIYFLEMPLKYNFYKRGNRQSIASNMSGAPTTELRFSASAGEEFYFYPETLTRQEAQDRGITDERFLNALDSGNFEISSVNVSSLNVDIVAQGIEIFDFGEALKDYSMTDFVKEVMFRKSLTPFPDVNDKHLVFKTLSERVDTTEYKDWSGKFVERQNELYQFGSYAKVNELLMKHDNDEDTFGNGSLIVTDENLKDNTTLIQSKYYAPSGDLVFIRTLAGEFFYFIKFWEREIKDDNGTQVIEYKPLKNRFFLLKEQTVNKTIKIGGLTNSSYPKAIVTGTMFSDVVADYYNDWGKIFDGLRIHNIELAINGYDLSTLRMDIPYYFKQEASIYILNKLSYQSGQTAMGEFLKIKE